MIYLLFLPQRATDSVAIIQVFKDTGYLLKAFTLAFVLNVVLSLVLLNLIGREGVPMATIIVTYALNVVNLMFCKHRCGVTFRQLVPTAQMFARFVAAVAVGIPLWWVCTNYNMDGFVNLAILAAGYFLVYFGLCRVTGLITLRDIRALMGRGDGL